MDVIKPQLPRAGRLLSYVAALIGLATIVSCGPGAREKTLSTTWNVTKALEDGFYAWDLKHQEQLLREAPDEPTFEAQITAYRAARERAQVRDAFIVVYRLIGLASINTSTPLPDVIAALAKLKAAIEALQSIASQPESSSPSSRSRSSPRLITPNRRSAPQPMQA